VHLDSKQRLFPYYLCALLFNLFLLVGAIRRNSRIVSVSHINPRNPRHPRHPRFSFLSKCYLGFAVGVFNRLGGLRGLLFKTLFRL
jgi:hypothetical protein